MPRRTSSLSATVFLAAFLLALLPGCSLPFLTPKVTTEYDRAAPLARRTYSWGGMHMEVPSYEPTVRAAMDRDLAKRGWLLAPSGGSLTLFAMGGIRSEAELESGYAKQNPAWSPRWSAQGWGSGWKPFYGEATVAALGSAESHLVVDIFDTSTHQLLFRGIAPDHLSRSEKQNTKNLQKALKLMFKKFPPKS